VGSITSPEGFLEFVDALLSLIESPGNTEFKNQVLANMQQPPYILARVMLSQKLSIPVSIKGLKSSCMPFYPHELEEIFENFGLK
jgi:hypothetical protein